MPVKKYRSELVSVQNPFAGIIRLEFKSLDGKFKYRPGQFLHIAIDPDFDGTGQWPESRCFSMQSNPDEKNICITYAVKGKFTNKMKEVLKVGSEAWLKLPYGDLFTQPHNKVNTVFIAGGTGITPFISLFTHDSFKEYKNPRIYLGFKSKSFNIYDEELNLVKSCDLKIFYENEEGFIDIDHILSENGTKNDYFISGPPMMIKTFRQSLSASGVPSRQILTDDWE
jgi:ferredoxin-NADP reductase